MAYMTTVHVRCTNKVCDYTGSGSVINGDSFHGEKRVCPKCGFKTLTDEPDWDAIGEALKDIEIKKVLK